MAFSCVSDDSSSDCSIVISQAFVIIGVFFSRRTVMSRERLYFCDRGRGYGQTVNVLRPPGGLGRSPVTVQPSTILLVPLPCHMTHLAFARNSPKSVLFHIILHNRSNRIIPNFLLSTYYKKRFLNFYYVYVDLKLS